MYTTTCYLLYYKPNDDKKNYAFYLLSQVVDSNMLLCGDKQIRPDKIKTKDQIKKRLKQILCRNKTGCFYVLLTTLLYCTYNYESTIVLYCRKIPSKLRFESHIPG